MAIEDITTISPSTNQPILTRRGLSQDDLDSLVVDAQSAFNGYRKSHPTLASRREIIEKALAAIDDEQDVLAKELTEQMGRPIAYTAKELTTAVMRGNYLNKVASNVLGQDVPGVEEHGFKRYIRREPVGVVLIIFAWNYPYLILVNSLLPALLAGNAVILKPSPQTPTIVEHMERIFTKAGLPKNVIQYFHAGNLEAVTSVVRNPLINHICFTGSVAGGLAVQKAAADRIVNVGLELGGKDPAYIRDDVDAKWVAEEIVDGAIFNSGQSCCSIERVYVASAIYDEVVVAIKQVLAGYKVGDPMDMSTNIGPVVSKRSKDSIMAQVKAAIDMGAKDETPANSTFDNMPIVGNFVKPTLLTGVTHEMRIMQEETFGPVIAIMKVSSDAEAIKLMNDSEFGLTASIWTNDVTKGETLAQSVAAGTVFVNRADYPSPDLAWTGWKNSGKGVTLSQFGFEQFVKLKSFHIKNYPNQTANP